MAVTQNSPAPYAPTSVILAIIERHRARGLPAPVNADVLARAGVSDSLIPRTIQALQSLDLLNEDLQPTQVLEGLRLAPEAEYKTRMGEWLQSAYADALVFIDPAIASETEIRDAFRHYKPVGQQDRMVSLFLGLFEAVGLAPERKRKAPAKQKASAPIRSARAPRAFAGGDAAPPPPQTQSPPQPQHHVQRHQPHSGGLPPALSGLLASLPQHGETWQKAERDRFLATFQAVLDFCYPVSAGATQKFVDPEEEDLYG